MLEEVRRQLANVEILASASTSDAMTRIYEARKDALIKRIVELEKEQEEYDRMADTVVIEVSR